jgi:hypothetical protein
MRVPKLLLFLLSAFALVGLFTVYETAKPLALAYFPIEYSIEDGRWRWSFETSEKQSDVVETYYDAKRKKPATFTPEWDKAEFPENKKTIDTHRSRSDADAR